MKILVTGTAGFSESLEDKIEIISKKSFLAMQLGEIESTYIDKKDLLNDMNYKPGTKLSNGIEEFVTWCRRFYI